MCVPTSEVGYTPAMPRREDHEVHKDMWWQWGGKKRKEKGEKKSPGVNYNCTIQFSAEFNFVVKCIFQCVFQHSVKP